MSRAEDAARAWRDDKAREEVDEAYAEQKHERRRQQVDEAAAPDNDRLTPEEALEWATDAWGLIDMGAQKAGGPAYALTEADLAKLIPISARMAQKHVKRGWTLQGLEDLVPLEWIFLGTVAWVYIPKRGAAVAAARAEAQRKAAQQNGQPPEKEVKGTVTERRGLSAVP